MDVFWHPRRGWIHDEQLHFEWRPWGKVRICGTDFNAWDYPECLDRRHFDCEECSFVFEEPGRSGCYLRAFPELRGRALAVLQPALESERKKAEVEEALRQQIKAHGRPLHYTVLTRMLKERYPELDVTEGAVLGVLRSSDQFRSVSEGVYGIT